MDLNTQIYMRLIEICSAYGGFEQSLIEDGSLIVLSWAVEPGSVAESNLLARTAIVVRGVVVAVRRARTFGGVLLYWQSRRG